MANIGNKNEGAGQQAGCGRLHNLKIVQFKQPGLLPNPGHLTRPTTCIC